MKKTPAAIDDGWECFRDAFEHSAVGRVLASPDGRVVHANPTFCQLLGRAPGELVGRHFGALTHPDDVAASEAAVRDLLAGEGASRRLETRCLRGDGSVVWGDVLLTLIRDEGAAPRMFVIDIVEITQQKGEERMLSAGRELAVELASARSLSDGLRLCVGAAMRAAGIESGGAYVVDETSGEIRLVCQENAPPALLERISLFSPGTPAARRFAAPDPTFEPAAAADAASGACFEASGFRSVALIPVEHETRVIAALGFATRAEPWSQQARALLLMFAAQVGGALARLRAEDAAREADARVRAMADHIKDGLIVLENDRVVYANRRMCEITGRSREELAAGGPWEMVAPLDRERLRAFGQQMIDTDELEHWVQRPDGSRRLVSSRFSSAAGAGRNFLITTDLTERRQLEQQLLHAQKLEAIGRLAGGVAHDFNNILTVIESCAATLQEELPEGRLGTEAAEIRRAAGRAAALTRQLLTFGRRSAVERSVVDTNAVIADMERMFRRVVGEDIALETRLSARRPSIEVDLGQLEQVLTNLVLNARDALPGGGRLTVETSDVEVDEATAGRYPEAAPGPHVLISVRDDGVGMSPDVMARIFEPFYTTKRTGQGSGLGLATVYGVVTQNRGFIVVTSSEGEGSAFDVYLPHCAERVARAVTNTTQHAQVAGRQRRILVVEDEEVVRRVVARTLERNGFTVVSVPTPRDALAEVAQRSERFDLVLTDVLLPVMSGPQMVAELRRSHPELRVLFMSGYAETGIPEGALLLPKPFRATELLRKVQQAME